jgi:YidC/Oxa1 family membrane protein insertase
MFEPFFKAIGSVLAWFYGFTHSYALAIVLLTLLILVLFTPLTIKGTRSMMAMSELQPEIKRLQAENKDDRQKLNEEMMKLYKSRGVNPLGGCLPSLIQLPVFFVLYRVINGITKTGDNGNFDPQHLDEGSQLFRDLSATDEMRSFGLDLARSANEVLRSNFVDSLPYLGVVFLTFLLAWFQQKQMKARRPEGAVSPNPQTEMLMKIMPFMLPVFAFAVPAALAIYFVSSSLYRIGQQSFIHKTMPPPPAAGSLVIDTEPIERKNPRSKKPIDAVPSTEVEKSNANMSADERAAARRARSEQRRGGSGKGSSGSTSKNGVASKDVSQPIQSRRTTGDTHSNRRKKR